MVWMLAQALVDWPGTLQAEDAGPVRHLFFEKRVEYKLTLEFKSSTSPYQVDMKSEIGKKGSYSVEIGKVFGFGKRFIATQFALKTDHDPGDGTDKDASELTLHDSRLNQNITLVKDVPFCLIEPVAFLGLRLKTTEGIRVGKGEVFRIPGQDSITYKLIDASDDAAIIARMFPDGTHDKEIVIPRGPQNES